MPGSSELLIRMGSDFLPAAAAAHGSTLAEPQDQMLTEQLQAQQEEPARYMVSKL